MPRNCFICRTCAVQYSEHERPPARCIICEDERQYVGWQGQQWTTLIELAKQGYTNDVREVEPNLTGIGVSPHLGIGQRALLVQTEGGNVLWDCIGYLDAETIDRVNELGGIHAISASHPHFYGSMIEWSQAFNNAEVYIPRDDEAWITRPDPAIQFWEDTLELLPGVTLAQCGGHFAGSAVLHWAGGADGKGVLLTGDTIQVVQDRDYVSFMWSFPNLIPMPATEVQRIVDAVSPYEYDRIYGGWWHTVIEADAQAAVRQSAARYISRMQRLP